MKILTTLGLPIPYRVIIGSILPLRLRVRSPSHAPAAGERQALVTSRSWRQHIPQCGRIIAARLPEGQKRHGQPPIRKSTALAFVKEKDGKLHVAFPLT